MEHLVKVDVVAHSNWFSVHACPTFITGKVNIVGIGVSLLEKRIFKKVTLKKFITL